ncbi:uncharacterized protein LOC128639908 isoform X2 [Bombina bombina]|uniref:uncharacterized protein LOC128639908 isoform X2 n=1 Tax=Bombina bombina TaxID=8345 RepID=UPI00235B1791|nr:uncharacterized protein LOC128639908 isoform X2 [Bombina bombina]
MKGISVTFVCIAALLILTMVPGKIKAATEEEEKQRAMQHDIELGRLAIEPPPSDDLAVDVGMNVPQAEEDRDHLYHPQQDTPRRVWRAKLKFERQIINGPEEDRDHLYHL